MEDVETLRISKILKEYLQSKEKILAFLVDKCTTQNLVEEI